MESISANKSCNKQLEQLLAIIQEINTAWYFNLDSFHVGTICHNHPKAARCVASPSLHLPWVYWLVSSHPCPMTSNLRLPITGFGAEMFLCSSFMRFIKNKLLFVPVKDKPSTKLYHPRMVSSPRSLLRNRNAPMGRHRMWKGKLDTGSMSHYTSL